MPLLCLSVAKTMRAIVKEKPGPGFALRDDVPIPRAGAHQVVVRVKAVGICGSDIPIFEGIRQVPMPLIPGHEFSGVISEVGADVRGWQVGDRVTAGLVRDCTECAYCRRGEESLCDHLMETGIDLDGAYAEYVAVPARTLHRLPDDMTFEQGAAVDPIASAYRAVRKADIRPEDTVAIVGPGPIGLYALQAVLACSPRLTIMIGRGKDRLAVARQLGADHVISLAEEDPVAAVNQLTNGEMAQVVLEATGNAEVVQTVIDLAAKGARVGLLGIFHHLAQVDVRKIVRRELRVFGSFCYTWDDFAASLSLLQRGKVNITPLVTHVMPLAEIGQALDLIKSRQAIKIILKP